MHHALRASTMGAVLLISLSACGLAASPAPTATAPPPAPVSTVAVVQSSPVAPRRFVAGLVTDVGGLGDRSFNDLAWAGIKAAERRDHIRGTVLQSRTESQYLP